MTHDDARYIEALRRGDRAALERFYDELRSARDDDRFWAELSARLPCAVREAEASHITQLRSRVGGEGYATFLRRAPVPAVAVFLALAMTFSGCKGPEPGRSAPPQTHGPAVEAVETPDPVATQPAAIVEPAPVEAVAPEETAQPPDPAAPDPETMTEDELRASLLEYIVKAELPAAEKKRLKAVVKKAKPRAIASTRSDLESLFEEEDPQKIADTLEEMVLFDKPKIKTPVMATKYKGVDF